MYPDKIEAEAVASTLHEEFYEAMMAHGEAMDFVVARAPGSGYVRISIGGITIWDSEDENSGNDQTFPEIMEYCREQLSDLADLFSVFGDARYQTKKKPPKDSAMAIVRSLYDIYFKDGEARTPPTDSNGIISDGCAMVTILQRVKTLLDHEVRKDA